MALFMQGQSSQMKHSGNDISNSKNENNSSLSNGHINEDDEDSDDFKVDEINLKGVLPADAQGILYKNLLYTYILIFYEMVATDLLYLLQNYTGVGNFKPYVA